MADPEPSLVTIESRTDSVVVVQLLGAMLVTLTPTEGDGPNVALYPMGEAESLYSLRFDYPWPSHTVGPLTEDDQLGFYLAFDADEEEFLQAQVNSEGIIFDHFQGNTLADTAVIGLDDLEAHLGLAPGALSELVLARTRAPETPYRCDDCGRVEPRLHTRPARDLFERLDPDGAPTDRECSACGALTYPAG